MYSIRHGFMTDAVWYEALDEAPARKVEYIRKMRRMENN
jgi:hypothetical protein